MNNNVNPEIMDKLTKVCLCRAINRSSIKNAIRKGALTLDEVREATGAMSGSCKGSRCSYKISELIESYKNNEWS